MVMVMEFWLHAIAGNHYADETKQSFYWLRLDDESIVKVDDNALSSSYLQLDHYVAGPSLDRSIYVVGHAEECFHTYWIKCPSKHIYRLDTSNLEFRWQKLDVELHKERLNPHIIQLDGKFYIFEAFGNYGLQLHPIEVYDPVTETIQLLPHESVNTSDYYLLGVDRDCKRIVFRHAFLKPHLAMYSPYNEDGNKWEIKETPFDLCQISSTSVPINHKTLYWVDDDHQLVAYNFDLGMLSVPLNLGFISDYTPIMSLIDVRNLQYVQFNHRNLLYHITGDRFCFIWYRSGPDDNKIHCTFLNISNVFADGRFVLDASELATHTYNIPEIGFLIRSITPIITSADIGSFVSCIP